MYSTCLMQYILDYPKFHLSEMGAIPSNSDKWAFSVIGVVDVKINQRAYVLLVLWLINQEHCSSSLLNEQ